MTTVLKFIEHPLFSKAHPDEAEGSYVDGRCTSCAFAEDKQGRRFLLWQSYGKEVGHWALSRHDPAFGSDLRLGDIVLKGLTK